MTLRILALAAALALPVLAGAPAKAQPTAMSALEMQGPARACQRALPAARRFVGRPGRVAERRFRAPRGVVVRACLMCTRDFRPNRLTFGLDPAGIVRSVSCG